MKILSLFTKTKEEKESKQAARVAKALARGQEALIDRLEAQKDACLEKVERMTEGKIADINTNTFNDTYHNAIIEANLIDKQLEIARKTQAELYSDSE